MPELISATTDDGLEFTGLLAEASGRRAIILHIHGMEGDFFTHLEPYFEEYPKRGISFLSGEHRGSYIAKRFALADGSQRLVGGAHELFEDCLHDIKAWVDFAERRGYQNIWLSAHSLAPAKAAYYLRKTRDSRVKGLILLSPSDNIGLVKDAEGATDHAICWPEAQRLHAEGKGRQLLSHNLWGDKVLSADTYLNLFSDNSNANVFHYYAPELNWRVVNDIAVPVIAFTGSYDDGIEPVTKPAQAMELLARELAAAPRVKTIVLEGADHSFKGFELQIIEAVTGFVQPV